MTETRRADACVVAIAEAFRPFAALGDGVERVLVDETGRVYAASDADFARAVDWGVTLRRAAPEASVALGTARYGLAAAPVGATGLSVAAARRSDRGIPMRALLGSSNSTPHPAMHSVIPTAYR